MPNWCASELVVEGAHADIVAFVDGFREAFASPGNNEYASAMIECHPEPFAPHVDAVQTPFVCAIRTVGGKPMIKCVWEPEYDVSDNHATIQFTSKWTLPWEETDLIRMSAAFPALKIMLRYAEAGMNFVGSYTMQNGTILHSEERSVRDDEIYWKKRSVRDDELCADDSDGDPDDEEMHYQGEYAELLAKSG